ncbi:MAG: hypothetical protein ACLRSD_05755 [Oscillibacter sp.]
MDVTPARCWRWRRCRPRLRFPGTVCNDFLTSGMTEEQVLENMRPSQQAVAQQAINDTTSRAPTFKT